MRDRAPGEERFRRTRRWELVRASLFGPAEAVVWIAFVCLTGSTVLLLPLLSHGRRRSADESLSGSPASQLSHPDEESP